MLCEKCGVTIPDGTDLCPQCRVQHPELKGSSGRRKPRPVVLIAVAAAVLVILAVTGVVMGMELNRSNNYDKAMVLLDSGDYEGALEVFKRLEGYRDSPEKARLCEQNIAYYQAVNDYRSGSYDSALRALTLLVAEGFPGAQEEIALMDEKILREGLTEEYKKFSDPRYYLWQLDIRATIDALRDMGINPQDLIAVWTEGFQYQVGAITVNGNNATVEVTMTCKQYHPAVDLAVRRFISAPEVRTMTEEEMNARLGSLIFQELASARPVTTTITISCTKSGSVWTISESAEYEYYKVLFGPKG